MHAQTTEQASGVVKTLSGLAYIDYNGQRLVARIGSPVFLRSQLVTAPNSTIGVTFRDQTVISLGPDSHLGIDQYLFSPNEGSAGLVATMARGTLNYVSGLIAKLKPDGVTVNTPTAVIGVRGTQFVVRVDPS
ncbi:MAG: FecR domain-containing protein [Hylemonella sp.]|nr:FecR domain-containing protein [Hylemonella sp.]